MTKFENHELNLGLKCFLVVLKTITLEPLLRVDTQCLSKLGVEVLWKTSAAVLVNQSTLLGRISILQ